VAATDGARPHQDIGAACAVAAGTRAQERPIRYPLDTNQAPF